MPVIFWIYGGGFQNGGANNPMWNGTWGAAEHDVIVVTTNFRGGMFGFLAADELRAKDPDGSTGNAGIIDQRMALQWVQTNIGQFGGDPAKVLIVGESSGANSVSQHLVREKSWGLFSSAVMLSGAFADGINTETVAQQRVGYDRLIDFLNCSTASQLQRGIRPPAAVVDCVMGARHEDLVAGIPLQVKWSPHIDGVDLVASGPELAMAGTIAPGVSVVAGSTREDGPNNPLYRDTVVRQSGRAWNGRERAALSDCDGVACTEADFRLYGSNMGLDATELEAFVAAYADPDGLENGQPDTTPGTSQWYWAIKQAGADSWAACPARRMVNWAHAAGNPAYRYLFTHVNDAPGRNGPHTASSHGSDQGLAYGSWT
jgi:carboxylesterase type B